MAAESLKPNKVTRDDPASDKLLKASAVIAIELLIVPAINFPANNNTFRKIPRAPQSRPYACRTFGFDTFLLSLMKNFAKIFYNICVS